MSTAQIAAIPFSTPLILDLNGDGVQTTSLAEGVSFDLRANAFLQHLVRNIVGSLVYVGKGRYPPAWMAEILQSRDRGRAAPTFPPQGLYLAGVTYEAKWALPVGQPESALARLQN
jgi:tRNA U38,U39,U40 pseudouridine synthase TruA